MQRLNNKLEKVFLKSRDTDSFHTSNIPSVIGEIMANKGHVFHPLDGFNAAWPDKGATVNQSGLRGEQVLRIITVPNDWRSHEHLHTRRHQWIQHAGLVLCSDWTQPDKQEAFLQQKKSSTALR